MRILAFAALLAMGVGSAAAAQDYPARPITLVVPFAAGGPSDTVARLTAEMMSKNLGQPIVVENVGGAGGTLGSARVASAAPDGYTVLLHHIGMATSATLYRKLPYDPRTAFEPIGLVSDVSMTIIGRSDLEPKTLAELITYIKAKGDKVTYGHAGVGSASHLCGMLFMSTTQQKMTAVPYKGTGPVMTDLIGKQIDMTCDQATNTTGPINSKQVKPYALTIKKRMKAIADVPTADEAGLKGFELSVWQGLYAPKGTPAKVVERLSKALQVALKDETLIKRFNDLATEPVETSRATPEALKKMLMSEIDRWAPIINASGQYAD